MRIKIAGLALAATATLAGGVALAQPASAQPDPAEKLEKMEERLNDLVDQGVITEERADEIRDRIAARQARFEERQADRQAAAQELADTLGLSTDDLRAALRSGSSLADLAATAGVDVDVVIEQLVARGTERINEAVAAERIDQTTAEERLAELEDKVTARVNGERPERGERHHRRGFGRDFGPRPDGAATD